MKTIRTITAAVCCLGTAAFAAPVNLDNPGFETWSKENASPSPAGWRYKTFTSGKDGLTAFEQSKQEKHSGEASLHLKDTVGGNLNHGIMYQMSGSELAPMRGKKAILSVWIKQVSASAPDAVGMSISIGGKNRVSGSVWVGATGAVDWKRYVIEIDVPADADGAQICFACASGWGRTAEAYFDDLEFTEVPAKTEAPAAEGAAK